MKTLLITVDELSSGGYPVRLYFDETGGVDWHGNEVASNTISTPLELSVTEIAKKDIRGFLLSETGEHAGFRAIGERLFRLLMSGPVRVKWEELRQKYPGESATGHEGLRTLLLVKPRSLSLLPWELISEGLRRFFLDPENPWVRFHRLELPSPRAETWPIRALIVVGFSKQEYETKSEGEAEAIEDGLRALGTTVDCEVLRRPTRDELRKKYTEFRPHIFHFIGHAKKLPGSDKAYLEFAQDDNSKWEWRAEDIVADLAGWTPRFVFLNACRSGDPMGQEKASAIADAFIDLRAAAVLGMQADVKSNVASELAASLFRALAAGHPIDCAMAKARQDVVAYRHVGLDRRDWCLPSLTLSVTPACVLPMEAGADAGRRRLIQLCKEFQQVRDFVDRKDERRILLYRIEPVLLNKYWNLLLVTGPKECGKTALVHWCLEAYAVRGRRVHYVDLRDGNAKDFVDILRLIRKGDPRSASLIRESLDCPAFQEFDRRLNFYLDGVPPDPVGGPDYDLGKKFSEAAGPMIGHIFSDFRRALEGAAGNQPLIIALDHFSDVDAEVFKQTLRPYLINFVAQGRLEQVRIILVLTDYEYKSFEVADIAASDQVAQLRYFKKCEFTALAREFFRYNRQKLEQIRGGPVANLFEFLEAYSPNIGPEWKPTKLRELYNLLST